MTKYKIVTDNGQLYTRNSDKIYTHAVVFTNESGSIQGPMFCARLDLAQKKTLPGWLPGKWTKKIYEVQS